MPLSSLYSIACFHHLLETIYRKFTGKQEKFTQKSLCLALNIVGKKAGDDLFC